LREKQEKKLESDKAEESNARKKERKKFNPRILENTIRQKIPGFRKQKIDGGL